MSTTRIILFSLSLVAGFSMLHAQSEKPTNDTRSIKKSTQAGEDLDLLYILDRSPASGLNSDRVGRNIVTLGDINGDGYDDWAAGLSNSGTSIHIYLGGPERRTGETPADIVIRSNDTLILGSIPRPAGDVNADGYDDLLLQLSLRDPIENTLETNWAVFCGGDSLDLTPYVILKKLDYHAGSVGMASSAGDVNNDGYDDILLDIPTKIWGPDTAHVYLFYGGESMDENPDVIFTGQFIAPTIDFIGGAPKFSDATAAGDVNNDGFDDIIVSCNEGAKLYFGSVNMDTVMDVKYNDLKGAGLGTGPVVSTAGDVNNDGYSDVLIVANIGNAKAFICYGGNPADNIPDVVIPRWAKETNSFLSSSAAGDINKDGYDDIVLGTNTNWSIDTGLVRVFYGGEMMDSIADVSIYSPERWVIFGASCAGGGDFDGDGYNDFLAGSVGIISTFTATDDAGSISLFYGGESVNDTADAVFSGISNNEGFGSSVANAGDVNNDGYQDLIVGAQHHYDKNYYSGCAYLLYGGEPFDHTPDLVFGTPTFYNGANRFFGKKVRSAGDVNGDGFSDIYIEEEYRVFLFLGGSEMDTIADYTFYSQTNTLNFSALGDVNKDGIDDIVYADVNKGSGGSAFLMLGGENLFDGTGVIYQGVTAGDFMGFKTSKAGDLNGDGYMDFMISVPGDDTNGPDKGSVYVYFGGSALSDKPDLKLYGDPDTPGSFGSNDIIGGGDINGDGYSDIAIGVMDFSLTSTSREGRIYIFYGGDEMDSIPDDFITGNSPGLQLGNKLGFLPDLNRDGFDELLTNEGYSSYGGNDSIVVYYGGETIDSIPAIRFPYTTQIEIESYIDYTDTSVVILIGDQFSNEAGPGSGRVIALTNRTTVTVDTTTIPADTTNTDTTATYIVSSEKVFHHRNYPNPFTSSTIIGYQLPFDSHVEITVHNMLGQKVTTLISRNQPAGYHEERFDAGGLPRGLYLYRIRVGNYMETGKMSLTLE